MLGPMVIKPVPHDTLRAARIVFASGHCYQQLPDELDILAMDDAFRALFPTRGQALRPPWRLALVIILACAEGLSNQLREATAKSETFSHAHPVRQISPHDPLGETIDDSIGKQIG
jgi:hypothetical protein